MDDEEGGSMSARRRERLWRAVVDHAVTREQQGWAHAVCAVCVATLDTVDAAALTLRARSRAQEMLAATDARARGLEETLLTLGEGPGVEAFERGTPVLVADIAVEHSRWPVFAEAALRLGTPAVFAFPLQVGAIRFGTLTFYRHRPGRLPSGDLSNAALLSELATTVLLEQSESDIKNMLDWARPVGSHQDLNIATGMIAGRLRISLDDAYARLRGYAFAADRSVLDVARDVVRRRIDLSDFPRR
jgi:hypothetical protein